MALWWPHLQTPFEETAASGKGPLSSVPCLRLRDVSQLPSWLGPKQPASRRYKMENGLLLRRAAAADHHQKIKSSSFKPRFRHVKELRKKIK